MDQISVGDLLWDVTYEVFGMVIEQHQLHDTWIVTWFDGRANWVYSETILVWKEHVKALKEKGKVYD